MSHFYRNILFYRTSKNNHTTNVENFIRNQCNVAQQSQSASTTRRCTTATTTSVSCLVGLLSHYSVKDTTMAAVVKTNQIAQLCTTRFMSTSLRNRQQQLFQNTSKYRQVYRQQPQQLQQYKQPPFNLSQQQQPQLQPQQELYHFFQVRCFGSGRGGGKKYGTRPKGSGRIKRRGQDGYDYMEYLKKKHQKSDAKEFTTLLERYGLTPILFILAAPIFMWSFVYLIRSPEQRQYMLMELNLGGQNRHVGNTPPTPPQLPQQQNNDEE